jgi:hypothetical protein
MGELPSYGIQRMIFQGKGNSKRESVYCVRGVVSPVLANLALDGLEGELRRHFPSSKKGDHAQVHVVRYCDGTPVQA